MFDFQDSEKRGAILKVVGVGGGGGNALRTMIDSNLSGVEFVAANTDLQALASNPAGHKIQLGQALTKGLGAGANPEVGRSAALEDRDRIAEAIGGADMVFITCGMGGGTGTGGAPVIAEVARELGALTVGVITKPFTFEGKRRQRQAEEGVKELSAVVDTLITIRNDRLLQVAGESTSVLDAFRKVDEVLVNAVKGISDVINVHGLINVDFADVRTIMSNQGLALMGTGIATGPNRAVEAATAAVHSPLLDDVDIAGAMGILINITGGSDLTLHEVNMASTAVAEAAHEDANIIFGSVIDEAYRDTIKITVIATGFAGAYAQKRVTNPVTARERETSGARGGWQVQQSGLATPIPAPLAPLAPPRHTAPSAPPVRHDDRDIPTHIRQRWEAAQQRHEVPAMPDYDGGMLDIPTFLRRQAD